MTIFLVTLTACGSYPSVKALKVNEADERMIENCQYLGDVYGVDMWEFHLTKEGEIEHCKSKAREQAADLGASHIVWTKLNTGAKVSAIGRAYRCPH